MVDVPGLEKLRVARYGGLLGASALAAAAFLGGALPGSDLRSDLPRILAQPNGPLALALWLAGTALMVAGWWTARGAPTLTLRWVLVTAALWAAPLAVAPPLGSRDVYAYACQGAVYAAGLDPYAVGPDALPCQWLSTISTIWRETSAPYGPLYVALAGAAVWLAHGNLWAAIGLLRLVAVGGVVLTACYLPRLARLAGTADAKAAWLGLAAPVVGVHLISGAHNDALMIGLGLAALYYAYRHRPLVAGVLFGAALAVKATAGVALPFGLLLLVPAFAGLRVLVRAGGWLAAGCVAGYGAVVAATGLGFGWVGGLRHSGDSVQWTSVPTGVGIAVGWFARMVGFPDATAGVITVARAVGVLILLVVLVAVWWRARGGNVLARCGWALLAVTALSPVFHPWYWLWPLAVLAAAGVEARWLAVVTAALTFLVLPDGYNLARATRMPGSLSVLALAVYLAARFVTFIRSRPDPADRRLDGGGVAAAGRVQLDPADDQ
jgi:alpha-1,6-mannosyltransferase